MSLEYLKNNPMPDDQGVTRPPMLVVHMSQGELQELDRLQGGASIDPDTGFREYSGLIPIFRNPEVRQIFDEVAAEFMVGGQADPNLTGVSKAVSSKLPPYAPSPSDFDPEVLETESHGVDGDNELAYLPVEIADYFDSLKGGVSYNADGLRQYFKLGNIFKTIIRVAAPIAGSYYGPVGAGLATLAAHKLTGDSWRDSAKAGLIVGGTMGAAGFAAKHFAPGFLQSNPAIANSLGQGPGGAFGNFGSSGGFSGLSSLFGSSGSSTGGGGATSGVGGLSGLFGGGGGGGDSGGGGGSSGFLGGLGKFITSPALPLLGGAALMYKGQRDAEKERKENERRDREDLENLRRYYNIQSKAPRLKTGLPQINTEPTSYLDQMSGREKLYYNDAPPVFEYAKGGSVQGLPSTHREQYLHTSKLVKDPHGPTKGQADPIKYTIPEGAFVMDASSTSNFGDGSSEAGGSVLQKANDILMRCAPKIKHIEPTKGPVKCLLSNDEYVFNTPAVSILGGGSNKRGAQILKQVQHNIRKAKTVNKGGLPPKAQPFYKYLPKNLVPKPIFDTLKKEARYV